MTTDSLTALITGGTSGIGRATAKKLAKLGIRVIVVGRNAKRGDETLAEIRAAGGKADFIASDLRNASSAREVAKRAVELGSGHVDILINNAGTFPFGPTDKTTEEEFDRVYSLNVKAPYFLVAELAPLMAKRGKGAIVNVSTMVADYGVSGMSLYGSSKAAINLLTKSWAAEYGPHGVRVNAVSPGPTRTEGTEAMGEGVEQLAAQAPAGRPATADEIAEAIVFLATDRSSFVYGAKLVEINPLALTKDGRVIASDAKVELDDDALFRNPEFAQWHAVLPLDQDEALASKAGVGIRNFRRFPGDVGTLANGAGLAMATMDAVSNAGGQIANFLDVGGGANAERVRNCYELVVNNTDAKVFFINIFGGITRGDEVARGVVDAMRETKSRKIPLVIRLTGTNEEEGRRILAEAGMTPVETMDEGAREAVRIAAGAKG